MNKLDKELDIGNVLKKLRRFRFLRNFLLDKNQNDLLKLYSSKFIPSHDELEGVSVKTHRKIYDREKKLKNYVDVLSKDFD